MSTQANLVEGRITDEALVEFARRISQELRIANLYNTEVTRDAVRHFCNGIGDLNPLYRDPEYAAKTPYRGLVAPPSWLYSVFPTWVLQGLPGVHGFHAGNDWEFYRPIHLGERIKPKCIFTGFEKKEGSFAGTYVVEHQEAWYYDREDVALARAKVWIWRTERAAARAKGKYAKLELPHPWTEPELAKVEADVLAEETRGAEPRYWEDVAEGQELPPVAKGPLGLTDMIAYCAGASPVRLLGHRAALELFKAHPAWGFRDPGSCAMEPVYSVHYNKAAANAAGLPFPYDVGVQRNSWLIQLFTNWMGDEGWLKHCRAEYREFVYLSDVIWLRGKVTRKHVDTDGDCCVEIVASGLNQRGKDTIPARATVCLPSRKHGYSPLSKRLDAAKRTADRITHNCEAPGTDDQGPDERRSRSPIGKGHGVGLESGGSDLLHPGSAGRDERAREGASAEGEIKAIDFMYYVATPEFIARWNEAKREDLVCRMERAIGGLRSYDSIEAMVREMDEAGVQKVFVTQCKIWSYRNMRMAMDTRLEEVADYVTVYPDRFVGLAGYDPFRIKESLREVERAVKEYGFRGVYVHVYGFDIPLHAPQMYPLYAKCVELGIPVSMQVGHVLEASPSEHGRPIHLDRIACDFPDLRIVGAHTGWPWVEELISVCRKWENVYLGIDAWMPRYLKAEIVQFINSRMGRDRCLWGSNGIPWKDCLGQIDQIGLKEESKRKVLRDNAVELFRL